MRLYISSIALSLFFFLKVGTGVEFKSENLKKLDLVRFGTFK